MWYNIVNWYSVNISLMGFEVNRMFDKVKKSLRRNLLKFTTFATLFLGNPSNVLGNTEGHTPETETNNPNTEVLHNKPTTERVDTHSAYDIRKEIIKDELVKFFSNKTIENLLELDKTDDSTLSRKEKEYLERTRAEFVKIVNRAFNIPTSDAMPRMAVYFEDVLLAYHLFSQ